MRKEKEKAADSPVVRRLPDTSGSPEARNAVLKMDKHPLVGLKPDRPLISAGSNRHTEPCTG